MDKIKNEHPLEIWEHSERNLIDKDDVFTIIDSQIKKGIRNTIVEVAVRESVKVTQIVSAVERHIGKSANVSMIDKGNTLSFNLSHIEDELLEIEAEKGKGIDYVHYLLKTYY